MSRLRHCEESLDWVKNRELGELFIMVIYERYLWVEDHLFIWNLLGAIVYSRSKTRYNNSARLHRMNTIKVPISVCRRADNCTTCALLICAYARTLRNRTCPICHTHRAIHSNASRMSGFDSCRSSAQREQLYRALSGNGTQLVFTLAFSLVSIVWVWRLYLGEAENGPRVNFVCDSIRYRFRSRRGIAIYSSVSTYAATHVV